MLKSWIDDLSALGSLPIGFVLALLMLLLERYILSLKIILCLVFTILASYLIRSVYSRERPEAVVDKSTLIKKLDSYSFPSTHAARTSAICALFYMQYPQLHLFFVLILAIVSVARIAQRKHYLSDVLGGIIIGIITAGFLEYLF